VIWASVVRMDTVRSIGNRLFSLWVILAFLLGDKAFVEFLTDEIKEEKKIQKHKSLPKMSGDWELEVNGTEAKLLRKVAGEK
jgi:hypothetical protein